MSEPWYRIANVDDVASPALAVFPARVRENTRRMVAMAGGPARLRPHVKTHKMFEVLQLQRAAGITKFKCATIAEAEMVARGGVTDVMLAYVPVGPNVARVVRLAQAFPQVHFTVLADEPTTIDRLGSACMAARVRLGVALDINNGMHRSGVVPGSDAVALYRQIGRHDSLEPGGLHVYDGHIREPDVTQRIAQGTAAFAPVAALRRELESLGCTVPRVVAGGTPSFPVHARQPDREPSPGTCVFWDVNYGAKYTDMDFLHAAVLVGRVISRPAADVLCLDLGYKAVSPDNPTLRVQLCELPDAEVVVHNEEHLALRSPRADSYRVGDVVYGIPNHICPTVALHRSVVVVEDGRATGTWPVAARDRVLSI